jgi:protocatechuate 3,4-dioxygenase beta subunit
MIRGQGDHPFLRRMGRRRALGILGALGAGALAAACRRSTTPDGPPAAASPTAPGPAGTAGPAGANPDCVLTPETTEGPYYLDLDSVRSDVREDREGAETRLAVTVVDAATCAPLRDAAVDIWHADAAGAYSGFGTGAGRPGSAGDGPRFLRGTQVTGADGVARFVTIYPGWYPGRAVHIHVKVHAGGREVHTGQLFFSDSFTESVYARAPYSARPGPDVRNAQDGIFARAQGSGLVSVAAAGEAYDASITLGVQPG